MYSTEVKKLIETTLPDSMTEVTSNDGSHFNAIVVSDLFAGKSKLAQQQMVYGALGENIKNGNIHAISLKTYTSAEWYDHKPGL